jgi:DNA-binding transcriptional regulator YiaG
LLPPRPMGARQLLRCYCLLLYNLFQRQNCFKPSTKLESQSGEPATHRLPLLAHCASRICFCSVAVRAMSSRLGESTDSLAVEDIGTSQADPRGDAANSPVVDALRATPAETEELRDARWAAEALDESPVGFEGEGGGVHETSLNTMFSLAASDLNAALNNKTFTSATIARMHATMERLYEAARLLHQIEGPAQLAKFLNVSEQLVNNWQRRGISKGGMLDAQKLIGCSATWLETGTPPMLAATLVSAQARSRKRRFVEKRPKERRNQVS